VNAWRWPRGLRGLLERRCPECGKCFSAARDAARETGAAMLTCLRMMVCVVLSVGLWQFVWSDIGKPGRSMASDTIARTAAFLRVATAQAALRCRGELPSITPQDRLNALAWEVYVDGWVGRVGTVALTSAVILSVYRRFAPECRAGTRCAACGSTLRRLQAARCPRCGADLSAGRTSLGRSG
jgi:hypothetical protein